MEQDQEGDTKIVEEVDPCTMRENAERMESVDPGEERLGRGSRGTSGKKLGKTDSNFSAVRMESGRKWTQPGI